MDWIERLNRAMGYIEEHLCDKFEIEEAARIACCSTYHFQRMFAYMAGVPLSEYVRRRRMTLAAVDLQSGGEKVVDVALKYGYESPTAFTRAFKSVHGIAPSEAKESGARLKAFPPVSFRITIKGDSEMNYRIEKKEAFRIVGISCPLEKELEKNFEAVPALWGRAAAEGLIEKLASMMDAEPKGILGVSACGEGQSWRYYISVATDAETDGELEEFIVPKADWAIFEGKGTNLSIQELEKRIVTEWLPGSGYEYGNAPDIEVYLNPDPQNAIYEVWIPVVKK
ncbi:AraC family transcriptional regulator [Clostridium sp. AF19-22AC]|jgi:AraC family transcriptional regulator|uniref:AraC family transcriptional regulator n=1 Tax=Faecalicatena orotica TaxID=1544 RepID=A0A2Y9C6R7_9FIRM|nr:MULTISPECIES: AraC family transcriptional regulator [Clostridia]PWJ20683.1 AraC family transcriptional regulator [Faecalicatena orotica]RHR22899.1 AraC family transcriptional regulator [Clostridium sp. AF19-22AC]SSA58622.1 transcriptional regulator, AraC family [Faecalicatena orotica]